MVMWRPITSTVDGSCSCESGAMVESLKSGRTSVVLFAPKLTDAASLPWAVELGMSTGVLPLLSTVAPSRASRRMEPFTCTEVVADTRPS